MPSPTSRCSRKVIRVSAGKISASKCGRAATVCNIYAQQRCERHSFFHWRMMFPRLVARALTRKRKRTNMKQLYFLIMVLALAVLGTSCSHTLNLSLAKRHYRDGFYVDMGSKKTLPQPIALMKRKLAPLSKEIKERDVPGLKTLPNEKQMAGLDPNSPAGNSFTREMPRTKTNAWIDPLHVLKSKRSLFRGQLMKDDEGHGYWLWTLVGILIVVWLILLLTGGSLGGLIYIDQSSQTST